MKLGLRVAVNTLVGAEQGVPALLKLFDEYQIQASFFFATGADKSGRLLDRGKQPWYPHLPLTSRLYGLVLMPPQISREAAEIMRSVAAAGHETGILCHDRARWIKGLAYADERWTRTELNRAIHDYVSVFGYQPKSMASAGWQTNPHLIRLQQEMGFDYACDVRGKSAFIPVLQDIESSCPQLPTTLPTLGELLNQGGDITLKNVHEYLYAESQHILPYGHVYACDAEMEGMTYLPVMEKLMVMWRNMEEGIQPLQTFIEGEKRAHLNKHQIGWDTHSEAKVYHATQSIQQP
ncbi:MAG: polysaccharide deacetylase family protein [Candidatus Thiodiazotropha sp. 6PDIVS]